MLAKLFCLLLLFLTLCDVNCKRRRKRCPSGLKMSSRGCVRARSIFWGLGQTCEWNAELWEMKQKFEKTLGRAVDVPCYDGSISESEDGQQTIYCEVCEVSDTNRVDCPKSAQVSAGEFYELCSQEEFDTTSCSKARCAHLGASDNDFVYYQSYDDGSICDCGAPFIITWTRGGKSKFRPARPSEVLKMPLGIDRGSSVQANPGGGSHTRAWWDAWGGEVLGSPSIPGPTTCTSRPDISSIFQVSSIPSGAGTDFYYEGCPDGRGLRCGGGNKPCWDICDCRRSC